MKRGLGIFLGLALVAPVLVGAARADEPDMRVDARVVLHAYRAIVEDEIADIVTGLRTLAQTEEARSASWDRAAGPLSAFAKMVPGRNVFLFLPDGAYYIVGTGLQQRKVDDRPYFKQLFAGHVVKGELVVSRSSGKKISVIGVPVESDGKVVAAVGASIDLEAFSNEIDRHLQLPANMVFFALDGHGRVALSRTANYILELSAKLGSDTLAAATADMLAKPEGQVRYRLENAERTVVFEKSREVPWVFALGVVGP